MHHPLEKISSTYRKKLFWGLLVVTLVVMILLNIVGQLLITSAAPYGIVSFELAGDVSEAGKILDSWDQDARLHAAFSLGFDYVWMLFYSTTIGLACLWAGEVLRERRWPLGKLGVPLAWGQWLAAFFDAIENIALALILFGSLSVPWPQIARWCAIFKFGLIFVGMVYAFLGLVAYLSQRQPAH
jgi:hypothetical protein